MSKTPEQMAVEHANNSGELEDTYVWRADRDSYLAGYQAAMNSPEKPDSWISVKERLPEVNKEILWYHEPGREFAIGLLHDGVEKPFFTHWMPLPEAPKEEK